MAEIKIAAAPQAIQPFYEKGLAAMERGNLDYAMDMFEAALQVEPRLLEVRRLLRTSAVKRARERPASKLAVAKALATRVKVASLLKKNPMEALAAAEKLLRIDPLNPRLAQAQCEAAERAGLSEAAVLTLEIINENRPSDLAVLEPLARLYRLVEEYDREFECRERIAALKPGDPAAAKELKDAAARLTMGKSSWQHAASFRDVVRSESRQPTFEERLSEARSKVSDDPGNLELLKGLADLELQGLLLEEAVETLVKYCAIAKDADPHADRKLAEARERLLGRQLAEAEDADDRERVARLRSMRDELRIGNLAGQVARYPTDLQLKFEFGKQLFEAGRHAEAIQQFQAALAHPQRRIRALLYLGLSFKAKGQPDLAMRQLECALGEAPAMDATRKEILYDLGCLHAEAGEREQALHCFKEIYAADIGYRDVASRVEEASS